MQLITNCKKCFLKLNFFIGLMVANVYVVVIKYNYNNYKSLLEKLQKYQV